MKKQSFLWGKMKTKFFLAISFLGIFGAGNVFAAEATAWSLASLAVFGLPNSSILGILINFLFWILLVLGVVGVIAFVIAGLLYLTAAGDETQITRAKKAMTYSLVGIIVGLSGLIAIRFAYTTLQVMGPIM